MKGVEKVAIQYLTYNDDSMESGKFYLIEANKDLVSNIREITSVTEPIELNTTAIKALQDLNVVNVDKLQDLDTLSKDNQNRINILEDRSLNDELMYALDQVSIKIPIINQNRIEIHHNRKEIYINKIMKFDYENFSTKRNKNITNGTTIYEEETKDHAGNIIMKKLIMDFGDTPISGYAIII